MDHAVVAAAGARARRSLAREPDVAHAHAARARHVTRERVGDAERVRYGRHQAPDGVGERERRRQRADERVVGRVEDAVEALAGDDDARVREEVVDAILPGDPVGVEGSPEVEQHRSGVSVQAIVRVKLVEAGGIEPTSGNPQPQASTSIADLLYSVSSPGTPTDGIAPGPASLFSPLPRS